MSLKNLQKRRNELRIATVMDHGQISLSHGGYEQATHDHDLVAIKIESTH
ncbi:MAG: hypothetical protein N0E38_00195 [Candidatus Thiodiazotropha endolucinida]|nr:hypothetical protein [Candidatus Thiodiazotropha endolucinida]